MADSSRRMRRRSGDSGFVLLETLVAICLIAVVMAGFTTFFVNSVASTNQQRATQIATQIANSAVEGIRALPASDQIRGHDADSVQTQFSTAADPVGPWLAGMNRAVDQAAVPGSGATAAVPTIAVTQTVNNVSYSVTSYFGTCVIPAGTTRNATCGLGAAATGISYLRAVVAVTWAGSRCPPAGCSYLTSTLISVVDDPLFSLSQSAPAGPVIGEVGAQTSAVGDVVRLQVTYQAVPTARIAVTSGSLPAGLMLDTATGLIIGTPATVQAATPLTLTLTDGFGRVATTRISWSVLPALTTTAPAAQASFIGTALVLTLPAATGGAPGYTWSDPGATLPPGLALSTVDSLATITGTPTTPGVFPVILTVTDSTTIRKSTVSFSWTTDYPPLVAGNPGPQTSTVATADSVTMSVTGGSGFFAWADGATLPAGLTLDSAGVITGEPTTAGVTSVSLVVTDTKSARTEYVTFGWTVYARPSVTSPGNLSLTTGAAMSLQLATSCPNAPCSYVLINGPSGVGINSTGLLAGTVNSPAQTFGAVTVIVTDSAGASVPSATFAVTVNTTPTFSSPGDQSATPGATVSLQVTGLAVGGTVPLTYSAVNLPNWLTINPANGSITGTAPSAPGTTAGIRLTMTDALGFSATSPTFSWVVSGGRPAAPLAVIASSGDTQVTLSWTAPTGPVTSYTATLNPGGLSCTTTGLSCVITGLTNGVTSSISVTASNGAGTGPASTAVTAVPYPAGIMSAANGMTLWLDGADPTVLIGNSDCAGTATTTTIGCWKDKSGRAPANNFVQAPAANRPGVSTWNGLSAANFADTGDVLASVDASANYLTVFVAANVLNSATYINLFSQAGVDYNVRIGALVSRGAPNGNDWSFNPAGTLDWANGSKLANANGPMKIITADQARSVKSFTASVSNALYGRGVVGQVGDVITFDKALTTAERRSVEEYLAHKWAVPITPQEPTAVIGVRSSENSATVSWAVPAFNGGAPISGYTVTSSPDGSTCTTTGALSCKVSDLTKKISHTFTVTATNSVGVGPDSARSSPLAL